MRQAVRVHRPSPSSACEVRFETIEEEARGPGEVLIRPKYVGICGSDLSQIHGASSDAFQVSYPHILGHEWVGEIVSAAAGSTFSIGDVVIGHGDLGRNQWFGFTCDGAMAETFAVEESLCFRVPAGVSMQTAATIEPFVCVYTGLKKIDVFRRPPASAYVLGLGTIGLLACRILGALGVEVVGVDPNPVRRQLAARFGAASTVDPSHEEIVPGAELVVEASGAASAIASTLEIAGQNASVLVLSISPAREIPMRFSLIQDKNLTVCASTGAAKELWPEAIDFVAEHAMRFDELVTSVLRFAEARDAFDRLEHHPDEIKILLEP